MYDGASPPIKEESEKQKSCKEKSEQQRSEEEKFTLPIRRSCWSTRRRITSTIEGIREKQRSEEKIFPLLPIKGWSMRCVTTRWRRADNSAVRRSSSLYLMPIEAGRRGASPCGGGERAVVQQRSEEDIFIMPI